MRYRTTFSYFSYAAVVWLVLTPSCSADIFGDIWNGVKGVVSAPVDLVGSVLGSGASAAADPVLDNAFARVRQSTDYAADKFQGVFDNEINKVDRVTGKRIDPIDAIAGKRIDQLDQIAGTRLDEVDKILDDKIGKIKGNCLPPRRAIFDKPW